MHTIFLFLVNLSLFLLLVQCQRGTLNRSRNRKRGEENENEKKAEGRGNPRAALQQWASSFVPEIDYNVTHWARKFRSRAPQDYFEAYNKKLSDIFLKHRAWVNFMLIGACDGTNDRTIRDRYLKTSHWRACFVEPMSNNVDDLRQFLVDKGVDNRGFVIRAAATSVCKAPTIFVERPLYEEKQKATNKTIPHWLRRQIGSILPQHRNHARPDWITEEVRCVTPTEIMKDWNENLNVNGTLLGGGKISQKTVARPRRRRIHILKIDVEGHDFEVLMGFFQDGTLQGELPLMINFEAKSINKKFDTAKVSFFESPSFFFRHDNISRTNISISKITFHILFSFSLSLNLYVFVFNIYTSYIKARMEKFGYVVSNFAADGFAMLRGDRMFKQVGSGETDGSEEGW